MRSIYRFLCKVAGATPQVVLALLTVIALTLAGLALWWLAKLSKEVLIAWAILATLGLPAAAWVGWLLGRYEAAALLRGVDTGIDKVAAAIPKLRIKPEKAPDVNVAVLPQLPPVVHRQLTDGEGEVIDL